MPNAKPAIAPANPAAAAKAVTRPHRPADRRSRPQRWRDAVDTLLALQADYADWLAALPDSLKDSATADALEAIIDLDLTPLAHIEPPRGYGVIDQNRPSGPKKEKKRLTPTTPIREDSK